MERSKLVDHFFNHKLLSLMLHAILSYSYMLCLIYFPNLLLLLFWRLLYQLMQSWKTWREIMMWRYQMMLDILFVIMWCKVVLFCWLFTILIPQKEAGRGSFNPLESFNLVNCSLLLAKVILVADILSIFWKIRNFIGQNDLIYLNSIFWLTVLDLVI